MCVCICMYMHSRMYTEIHIRSCWFLGLIPPPSFTQVPNPLPSDSCHSVPWTQASGAFFFKETPFSDCSLCARHYAKNLLHIVILYPPNNPRRYRTIASLQIYLKPCHHLQGHVSVVIKMQGGHHYPLSCLSALPNTQYNHPQSNGDGCPGAKLPLLFLSPRDSSSHVH